MANSIHLKLKMDENAKIEMAFAWFIWDVLPVIAESAIRSINIIFI